MWGAQGLEEANGLLLLEGVGLWVAQASAWLPLPHCHVGIEHTE